MLGLFAKCMFEATRISAVSNAAAVQDRPISSGRGRGQETSEFQEDREAMRPEYHQEKLTEVT